MKELQTKYNEWREELARANEEVECNQQGTYDCGEVAAREDFTAFAKLEEEITFEEMKELEENY